MNLTSALVSSWPSWNFTPWRSLKVQVRSSSDSLPGLGELGLDAMLSSKRTSWL